MALENHTFSGIVYQIPRAQGDLAWGGAFKVDGLLCALADKAISVEGGSYPLTSELNFGTNFGLKTTRVAIQYDSTATPGTITFLDSTGTDLGIGFVYYDNTGILPASSFLIGGGTPVIISATELFLNASKVGVGTRSSTGTWEPTYNLDITDDGPQSIVATAYSPVDATQANLFSGRRARGSFSSPSAALSGDLLVSFGGSGYGATGFFGGTIINITATQDHTDTHAGSKFLFYTTPNNSITGTLALTLDQDQSATFANSVTATTFVGAFSGTVTNATNVAVTDTSTNAAFYPTFVAASSGNNPINVDATNLTYNPSTNYLNVARIQLNPSAATYTPSGPLDYRVNAGNETMSLGVYVGDTGGQTIYLRKARGTIASPSQALSGDFLGTIQWQGYSSSGSMQGVALITAQATQDFTGTNAGTKLVFATNAAGGGGSNTALTLNADGSATFLNTVTATTFVGAVTGTATTATNTTITDDTTTNATMYPTWVTVSSGDRPQKVSSTKLTFNPSSGTLTATTFVGALTGTASGNLTYTANNHGVLISGSANTVTVLAPDASATKVLKSGGASADPSWLAYDNANTVSTLVFRDSSGNFSAGTITATLTGTASGNTTYTANNHGVVISGSGNAMTVIAPDASTTKVLVSGGASADPTWGIAYTSAATATTLVSRDSNANTQVNNLTANLTSTATAAGTTTLTVSSARNQVLTGTTTQTVKLPDATTLANGHQFIIANQSTGAVTVQDNGANTKGILPGSGTLRLILTDNSTSNGTWDILGQRGTFSWTFTGPFVSDQTKTVSYVKIGRQVTLHIPTVVATFNAASTVVTTTNLPTGLDPLNDPKFVIVTEDGSVNAAGVALLRSGNSLVISPGLTGANFVTTGLCGWDRAIEMTYIASSD